MTTDILSLSELKENQSAKYLTHNEALRQIEAMLVRVLSRSNEGPPDDPSEGDVYIVDDTSGDWEDANTDDIAHYYSGAWHFYSPIEGLFLFCLDEDTPIKYSGSTDGWEAGLGLGTMAQQDADSVDITGGSATGMTQINFKEEYDNGTADDDITIDWSNGNNQKVTVGADLTLSFDNMGVGHKQLKVIQDPTGDRSVTLPSGKWPGGSSQSFSDSAEAEDTLSIYYDGTDYYYQLIKGWA